MSMENPKFKDTEPKINQMMKQSIVTIDSKKEEDDDGSQDTHLKPNTLLGRHTKHITKKQHDSNRRKSSGAIAVNATSLYGTHHSESDRDEDTKEQQNVDDEAQEI